MKTTDSTGSSETISAPLRALHVATLCCFAVAQPLMSLLPQRNVYLHDLQPQWPEIIGLVVVLMVVVPGLSVLIDRLVVAATKGRAWPLRDAVLWGFVTIVGCTFARATIDAVALQRLGISWILVGATGLSSGAAFSYAYRKFAAIRQFVSVMAIAYVLFPASFLVQMAPIIAAAKQDQHIDEQTCARPVPIVLIVFDEFSLLPLLDDQFELDAVRFPNFARLANSSTWYRNATSNHGQTSNALPTLLTGLLPQQDGNATKATDLFQHIRNTKQYDMAVFEPVSRLCSEEINPKRAERRSVSEQLGSICRILFYVYPSLVVAKDFPFERPSVPLEWFGMTDGTFVERHRKRGLLRYNWAGERDIQLHHFLDCLKPNEKPVFAFLHVALPHYPWCFLPGGEHYISEGLSVEMPPGTYEEQWEDEVSIARQGAERYLLQLGFVDHFIGLALNRLKAEGVFDECLFIVTADHGVSFEPGHSRRKPEAETIGDLASIPLFVKLPRQSTGSISDRNVESIDIVPTIASVIGLPVPTGFDGSSLTEVDARERPRKTMFYDHEMTIFEPHPKQPRERHAKYWSQWNPGAPWEKWVSTASRPELLGRQLSEFEIVKDDSIFLNTFLSRRSPEVEHSPFSPRFIQGNLTAEDHDEFDIVCVENSEVIASTRALKQRSTEDWYLLLPSDIKSHSGHTYEVFVARRGQPRKLIRTPHSRFNIVDGRFVPLNDDERL